MEEEKPGSNLTFSVSVPAIRRSGDVTPLLSPVTQAGALLGTPLYMSPEQHLGDPIDSRTDQFSFCVALYEALYGKLPFAGTTLETLAFNAVKGNLQPRPPGSPVPNSVHHVLVRGLSPSPAQRFPSMRELLTALIYDPSVDLAAGPRARKRVAIGMISFMFIAAAGMKLLTELGVSPFRASLGTAFAYFAVFVILAFRFRRAFRNPFHRGMLVFGLVFGGQVLCLRIIGALLGLTHTQSVTLDLVACSAMSCVTALLVMPSMWPAIPLGLICALAAVRFPEYAQGISSGAVVLVSSVSLLLWSRATSTRGRRARTAVAAVADESSDRLAPS